jgi:hypothetical protein
MTGSDLSGLRHRVRRLDSHRKIADIGPAGRATRGARPPSAVLAAAISRPDGNFFGSK